MMNATLSHYGIPARSIFKSASTKPLPHGTCNLPWNTTEETRDLIDATKQPDESRNNFLHETFEAGIESRFGKALADVFRNIRMQHKLAAQLGAGFALVCVVFLMGFGNAKKSDMARSTQTTRTAPRSTGRRNQSDDFIFTEEFAA